MTGYELNKLTRKTATIVECEHCHQQYGRLPDDWTYGSATLRNPDNTEMRFTKGAHCAKCGMCKNYTPKTEMYHPMGDAPICKQCYQTFKQSDSCYTFEEDIAD